MILHVALVGKDLDATVVGLFHCRPSVCSPEETQTTCRKLKDGG